MRRDDGHGHGGPVTTRVGDAVVVTLPRELDGATLHALRTSVMERLRHARARAVVFEASGLDMIDAAEFHDLADVARTASWLGVRPMLVGLSAGIVGYVVDAGLDTSAFEPYGTLDDALEAIAATSREVLARGPDVDAPPDEVDEGS